MSFREKRQPVVGGTVARCAATYYLSLLLGIREKLLDSLETLSLSW